MGIPIRFLKEISKLGACFKPDFGKNRLFEKVNHRFGHFYDFRRSGVLSQISFLSSRRKGKKQRLVGAFYPLRSGTFARSRGKWPKY